MTLFLLISFVYPNGQHLRPDLTTVGDSVFLNVVRLLYKIQCDGKLYCAVSEREMPKESDFYCGTDRSRYIDRFVNYAFETAQCCRCNDCIDFEYPLLPVVLQGNSRQTGTTGRSIYKERDSDAAESLKFRTSHSGYSVSGNF